MIFFRIGAIVLIITAALHMYGSMQELKAEDDKQELLLDLMTNVEIPVGSEVITMMGLVRGYSLCFALLFLWSGTNSLFLSIRARDRHDVLKSYALINTVMLAIGTTISYTYFFFAPTTCLALALVLFAISYFRFKQS